MTPEMELVAAIATTVVPILALLVALATFLRGGKDNAHEEGENDGRVLARLDSIDNGIRDIKAENRTMRNDIREVRDIALRAEESAKSAHHRLDRAGIDGK